MSIFGPLRKLWPLSLAGEAPAPAPPLAGDRLFQHSGESEISGAVEAWLGAFTPRRITLDTMRLMRTNPDVAFGTAIVRAPLVGLNWTIESRDPKIKAFVEQVLRRRWRKLAQGISMAIPFGFQVLEKVWKTGPYSFEVEGKDGSVDHVRMPVAWTLERFKTIEPETLTLVADPLTDEFIGVRQADYRGGEERRVSAEQLVLWSFRDSDVYGKLGGFPLYHQCYCPWYSQEAMELFANRFFERRADPTPKGRASSDAIKDSTGKNVDGYTFMRKQMQSMRNGGFVILPAKVDEKTGKPIFDIEYMTAEDRGDSYQRRIDKLGTKILRGLFVPDEVGTSQEMGGRARSQTHADTLAETVQGFVDDAIDDVVNPQVVDPLVLHNFGQRALEESKTCLKAAGISPGMRDTLKEVLFKVMDAEATLDAGGTISTRKRIDALGICKNLDIPVLPADEVEPDPPAPGAGEEGDAPEISPEDEEAAARANERRGAAER